tara:strand:- start:39 stop:548 length:510 start_codon:yes stop_codon:yes gene_type:complete
MAKLKPLQVGESAPSFKFQKVDGERIDIGELLGKPYLVYFYPKDNTPGCNQEACGFSDSFAEFERLGITIIGVSADSEKSHDKFRKKFSLPFPLVSDSDRTLFNAFYGASGKSAIMGRIWVGANRMSFLVGSDGKILKTYERVNTATHAKEVLADIRALSVNDEKCTQK